MQTRKIAVEIKTIDDKHCSKDCNYFYEPQLCIAIPPYQLIGITTVRGTIGYLRTKECLKREIK